MAVITEKSLLARMITAELKIIPITTALMPLKAAANATEFLSCCKKCEQINIKKAGGKNMDNVALSAPQKPEIL